MNIKNHRLMLKKLYKKLRSIFASAHPILINQSHDSSNKQNAIICYTVDYSGSNFKSSLNKILVDSLIHDYNVYLCDSRYRLKHCKTNFFHLVIGFGKPWRQIAGHKNNKNQKLVLLETEMHPHRSSSFENLRVEACRSLFNIKLSAERSKTYFQECDYALADFILSPSISCFDFNKCYIGDNVFLVDFLFYQAFKNSYSSQVCGDNNSLINQPRRDFCLIVSRGCALKGLYFALDCWKRFYPTINCNLHIIGRSPSDIQFPYGNVEGIEYHGWLDDKSLQFTEILNKCSFFLNLSSSEAFGCAQLLCLEYGLIPISIDSSGIAAYFSEGFRLTETELFEFRLINYIQKALRLNCDSINEQRISILNTLKQLDHDFALRSFDLSILK